MCFYIYNKVSIFKDELNYLKYSVSKLLKTLFQLYKRFLFLNSNSYFSRIFEKDEKTVRTIKGGQIGWFVRH